MKGKVVKRKRPKAKPRARKPRQRKPPVPKPVGDLVAYLGIADSLPETREQWLERAGLMLRTELMATQLQGRSFKVSCGFPTKNPLGRTKRSIGECWPPEASTDKKNYNVFVSPSLEEPRMVLHTLLHEMCHVAANSNGHKAEDFGAIAAQVGFKPPWKSTPEQPWLTSRLLDMATRMGAYPHSAISQFVVDPTKGGDDPNDPLKDWRKKKPANRSHKLECPACGYTVRASQKWIEMGLPSCCCEAGAVFEVRESGRGGDEPRGD